MCVDEQHFNEVAVDESHELSSGSLVHPQILNSIFDAIPMIMILVNQEGKVEHINRTATIALGKGIEDSIGLLGGELFGCVNSFKEDGCGKNRDCSECTVRNSVMHTFETSKSVYKKEGELEILKNGQSVTLTFSISTTLMQYGNDHVVLLTADDITEQKLSNKAIKETEMKYKGLADSLPQTIFETDLQGNLTFVNHYALEMFGYTQEDIDKGFSIFQGLIPEDVDRAKLNFEEVIDADRLSNNEYTALRKDGSTFPVNIYVNRIVHDGKIAGVGGILVDVTKQIEAEEQLKWESTVNESLAELSNALIDPEQTIKNTARVVLKIAKTLTDSKHGFVSTIDYETGDNVAYRITDMMEECKVSDENKRFAFAKGSDGLYPSLWGHALNTKEAFYTNSPQTHKISRGIPKGHIPLNNFLSSPAVVRDKVFGEIALANSKKDYTERELDAIKRIAELYGLSMERKQTEEALRKSEASLSNAQRISHVGNYDWDIVNDKLKLSDEVYRIYGLENRGSNNSHEVLARSIHPDDQEFV